MSTIWKAKCATVLCLFLPFLFALAMLCLVITHANATGSPYELDQPNPVILSVLLESSVWEGEPGWLFAVVGNIGTITACGVYSPDRGCSPLLLEVFLNPKPIPVPPFPIDHYGDCFEYVPPLPPGMTHTIPFSFTLDPDLRFLPGYCPATVITEICLTLDGSVSCPVRWPYDLFLPVVLSASVTSR